MNELTLVKDQTIIDLEAKLQNSLKYAKELIVNDENSAKSASDSMGLLKIGRASCRERVCHCV